MVNLQISSLLHNRSILRILFATGLGLFLAANVMVDYLFESSRNIPVLPESISKAVMKAAFGYLYQYC